MRRVVGASLLSAVVLGVLTLLDQRSASTPRVAASNPPLPSVPTRPLHARESLSPSPLLQSPLPPPPPWPAPPPAPPVPPSPPWNVQFAQRARGATDFAGRPTLGDRDRMLTGCRGRTKCGFMAPSGYDALAARAAALSAKCETVVLTAVFGRKDKLQQPVDVPPSLAGCYFAFVDEESATFLRATASPSVARNGALSDDRIGAWHLLTLTLSTSPYSSPRRASRVPKLLPFMFFPRTNYSLWVDGKLKLLVDPTSLIKRFLKQPRASLALPRNLRRDHIDEEVHWIRAALATEPSNQQPKSNPSGKQGKTGHTAKAAKLVAADAKAVDLQWAFYEAEQRNWSAGGSAGRNGGSGAASWTGATACAEGAMILANLQSALTRCVLCSWFNEWHRFGERDQLSLSYVLHAMRLTPPPEPPGLLDLEPSSERRPRGRAKHEKAHRGVYLWPRYDHWHHKRNRVAGERKRPKYVRYMGHGGCADGQNGLKPNPGCSPAAPAAPSQLELKVKQS